MAAPPPQAPTSPLIAEYTNKLIPPGAKDPVVTTTQTIVSAKGFTRTDMGDSSIITKPDEKKAILLDHVKKEAIIVPLEPPKQPAAPPLPGAKDVKAPDVPKLPVPPDAKVEVKDLGTRILDGHEVRGKQYTITPPVAPAMPAVPAVPKLPKLPEIPDPAGLAAGMASGMASGFAAGSVRAPNVASLAKLPAPPLPGAPKLDPKLDAAKLDLPKADAAKLGLPKLDAAKLDPKLGVPKLDAPKLDAPKLDAPKLDAPKLDAAKLGVPKLDVPKLDVPKLPAGAKLPELPKLDLASKIPGAKEIPLAGGLLPGAAGSAVRAPKPAQLGSMASAKLPAAPALDPKLAVPKLPDAKLPPGAKLPELPKAPDLAKLAKLPELPKSPDLGKIAGDPLAKAASSAKLPDLGALPGAGALAGGGGQVAAPKAASITPVTKAASQLEPAGVSKLSSAPKLDVPKLPDLGKAMPKMPEAPKLPLGAKAPELPKTPEIGKPPIDAPKLPMGAKVPEPPKAPELPKLPPQPSVTEIWTSTKHGIPMLTRSKGDFGQQISHCGKLVPGEPPASMFEIPPGYKQIQAAKLPAPDLPKKA